MLTVSDSSSNKYKTYSQLIKNVELLLQDENELISALSNLTALLKQTFPTFSWVGFYIFNGEKLKLGPFQGKVACSEIEIGKGVCGTSALKKESILVHDVHSFPGHIACDEKSKSEIVIPICIGEKLFGVLDIDSYNYSNFDETDKDNLQKICYIISSKIEKLNSTIL
ncbi:MAG: GAF domain-containing protein [Ignavibacteria bacterium]|nr:GAF domain-containing protein [Ignavibacteria bacterium]